MIDLRDWEKEDKIRYIKRRGRKKTVITIKEMIMITMKIMLSHDDNVTDKDISHDTRKSNINDENKTNNNVMILMMRNN